MKGNTVNYKYINSWLSERNLKLEKSFAENLYDLACKYKKRTDKF